jgi:hypothetical protein
MSATDYESTLPGAAKVDTATEAALPVDSLESAVLELSPSKLDRAFRDVALEELEIVRERYLEHLDPVRCAVGISLVLRSLAKEFFGEERICRLRRLSWLNFLLRTSDENVFRPQVIETMSAALYGDPCGVELPLDCSLWFDAAETWIEHPHDLRPMTTFENPVGSAV